MPARIYTWGLQGRPAPMGGRQQQVARPLLSWAAMSGGAKKGRPRVVLNPRSVSPERNAKRKRRQKGQPVPRGHRAWVRQDGEFEWTAICTCGWSAKRTTKPLAHEAREDHRRLAKRPKSSKRSMPNWAVHKLSLDERPDGRWIAKCKCGWKNEKPTRVEAEKVLQSHQVERGGVRLDQPRTPKGLSVAEAKRNIHLQKERAREVPREVD